MKNILLYSALKLLFIHFSTSYAKFKNAAPTIKISLEERASSTAHLFLSLRHRKQEAGITYAPLHKVSLIRNESRPSRPNQADRSVDGV